MSQTSKNAMCIFTAVVVIGLFWLAMYVALRKNRDAGQSAQPVPPEPEGKRAQPQADINMPGETREGWLGIRLKEDLDSQGGQGGAHLVKIASVSPGSPAARAGIETGDLIIGIQGKPPGAIGEVMDEIRAVPPGTPLLLELLRAGEGFQLSITRGSPRGQAGKQLAQGAERENPRVDMSPQPGGNPTQVSTRVFINGRQLTTEQISQMRMLYGFVLPPGRYWYDSRGGLLGTMGREAAVLLRTGHDFGPLAPDSSHGNTGVFINGREINMVEAMYCQQLFGAVYQGHYWLDGTSGNMGIEGNPTPLVNVFLALRQAQQSRRGGSGYGWQSNVTGAYGNSEGGCSYVSIPGTGTVSSGCD